MHHGRGRSVGTWRPRYLETVRATAERYLGRLRRSRGARHPASIATNLVSVGIAAKRVAGARVPRLCLCLGVERKIPKALIPKRHQVPPEVEGMETDVIEIGRFTRGAGLTLGGGVASSTPGMRPGSSISFAPATGNQRAIAGTLGCYVVDASGRVGVLSNNHILANENGLKQGADIQIPGARDAFPGDVVADLEDFVLLDPSGANLVDAAYGVVRPAVTPDPRFADPRMGRLQSPDPVEPEEGFLVKKVGRTTGFTEGVIIQWPATVRVQDFHIGASSGMLFVEQMLVRGVGQSTFAADGDSGSLVVDEDTGQALGLVLASSSMGVAAVCRLEPILASMGLRLLT